jgi:hypothetical protein
MWILQGTLEVYIVAGLVPRDLPIRGWLPHVENCGNVKAEFCPDANLFCNDEHLGVWRPSANLTTFDRDTADNMACEGLDPKGTDQVNSTTAIALKELPIAAKHPHQLFLSGTLSLLALGAVAVSYLAIATLVRSRAANALIVSKPSGGCSPSRVDAQRASTVMRYLNCSSGLIIRRL